jgi:hypothetical protein
MKTARMEDSERRALEQRLDRAATRLKSDGDELPERPAYASPVDLGEVLTGLEDARSTVHRARRRLAEIEAALGGR